jgi:hypothetical protein
MYQSIHAAAEQTTGIAHPEEETNGLMRFAIIPLNLSSEIRKNIL